MFSSNHVFMSVCVLLLMILALLMNTVSVVSGNNKISVAIMQINDIKDPIEKVIKEEMRPAALFFSKINKNIQQTLKLVFPVCFLIYYLPFPTGF